MHGGRFGAGDGLRALATLAVVAFHGDTRSRRLVLKTAERSARRLLARARRVRITLRSTEKVDDAATPFSTTRLTAR